jgi:hypothetical protein
MAGGSIVNQLVSLGDQVLANDTSYGLGRDHSHRALMSRCADT